jgi:Zn-dependent M28 family amino/carboxypeptidase
VVALWIAAVVVAEPSALELAIEGGARIDRRSLERSVLALQESGSRVTGSSGEQRARSWIEDRLSDLGASVTKQPVALEQVFEPGKIVRSENIIARFGPSEAKARLVLIAHLDSKGASTLKEAEASAWKWESSLAPGADDNASGAASLLEIARLLERAPRSPSVGVDVVFTAGEELAILDRENWMANIGAEQLADRYDDVEVIGAISVDMILRARSYGWILRAYTDGRIGSQLLAEAIDLGSRITSSGARVETLIDPAFTFSDHGSFWARGWPALLLIEDDFHHPRYHQPTDRYDPSDPYYSLDQLEAATRALWGAIALLVYR